MPMKTVTTTVMLSCLVVAGCVAIYQPRSDRPTAHVRITTNTDDNTSVFIKDAKGCESGLVFLGVQMRSHDESNFPRVVLGQSGQPPSRTRERNLEANERVELTAMSGVGGPGFGGYTCQVGVSFIPRDKSHYELEFLREASAKRCAARLAELREDSTGQIVRLADPSVTYFRPTQPSCTSR